MDVDEISNPVEMNSTPSSEESCGSEIEKPEENSLPSNTSTGLVDNGEQACIRTVNLSGKSLLKLKVKKSLISGKSNVSPKNGFNDIKSRELGSELPVQVPIKEEIDDDTYYSANGEPESVNEPSEAPIIKDECQLKSPVDLESNHDVSTKKKRRGLGRKKKIVPAGDPDAFNTRQKGNYVCWICYQKFTLCLNAKKHILHKHRKAFCALMETEGTDSQTQLLLFCPKSCKYATSNSESFYRHVAMCQEPDVTENEEDFVQHQDCFMAEEYSKLRTKAMSSSIMDLKTSEKLALAASKKKSQASHKDDSGASASPSTSNNPNDQLATCSVKQEQGDSQGKPSERDDNFFCHQCNKTFTSGKSLQRHVENTHALDNGNADPDGLLKQEEHEGNEAFICNLCGKTFSANQYLLSHMRIHRELTESRSRAFQCDVCKKTFNRTATLITHMRIHTGERPFECKECGRCFTTSSNFLAHVRIHSGERPFKCKECQKSFCRKSDLKTHMRIHTGEKPFKCIECGQSFRTNSNILNHMRTHTGEKPYVCTECGKTFSRSGDLIVHKRTHTGERPYECTECGLTYKTSWNLAHHMKTHANVRPHKCPVCSKNFYRSCELQIHMRIHTGEKPFTCSECNKDFVRSGDLLVHMRMHTGSTLFSCDQCEKTFSRNIDLVNHMRSHTGEKPFECSECGKAFGRSGTLSKHMRTHMKEKRYSCMECGESFGQYKQLKAHGKTHGGDEQAVSDEECVDEDLGQSDQDDNHHMETSDEHFDEEQCDESSEDSPTDQNSQLSPEDTDTLMDE